MLVVTKYLSNWHVEEFDTTKNCLQNVVTLDMVNNK